MPRLEVRALSGAAEDYDGLLDLIGDADVVLLGEASHGTHEFYRRRLGAAPWPAPAFPLDGGRARAIVLTTNGGMGILSITDVNRALRALDLQKAAGARARSA